MLDAKTVLGWSERLGDLIERLAPRFPRKDLRGRAESYLRGLLGSADRKNSWQLADATGAATPHGFQRLLGRARWDADAVPKEDQGVIRLAKAGTPANLPAPTQRCTFTAPGAALFEYHSQRT